MALSSVFRSSSILTSSRVKATHAIVYEIHQDPTRDVLEGVCVLDIQESQVHVSPILIRLAPRGEVPLGKAVALLVPVCAGHEEWHEIKNTHVIPAAQAEHVPYVLKLHLNRITDVNTAKGIDETEPRSHVVTRSQHAPEVADDSLEGPGRNEETISRLVAKFLVSVFVFGAFLGHGTAGGLCGRRSGRVGVHGSSNT